MNHPPTLWRVDECGRILDANEKTICHSFTHSEEGGANIHSTFKDEVSLEDLGLTEPEWDALSNDEKEELVRPLAFDLSDWGFRKIEEIES